MTDTTESRGTETDAAEMLDPSLIMQIGMGFWPSKALLSAVELGLFTTLGSGTLTGMEIAERLTLRSRAVYDFLDGLVALRMLERDGLGEEARYRTPLRPRSFLIATARPTSAAFLRWRTLGCTASGAG